MDKELFKRIIKAVESSGGTNVTPTEGTKYGVAGGAYQITPGEIQSLPQRMRNDDISVPEVLNNLAKEKDYAAITKQLNANNQLDETAGDSLSQVLLKRNQGDLLKAAYRHHMGTNAPIPKNTGDMFQETRDPEYLQKVLSAYVNSSPDKNILDREKFNQNRDADSQKLMDKQNFELLQNLLSRK